MSDKSSSDTDLTIAPVSDRNAVRPSTSPLVAVVGADGFVGGGLAKALRSEDSLQTKKVVYGPAADEDIHISRAEGLLRQADVILNCGGFRVRLGCDYQDYQSSHKGSTSVFVPWIKKDAVLIHISSASVLGKGHGLGNHTPPDPATFPAPGYALAKLEEERYLEEVSIECGFRVIFLRPAVLYSAQGAGMVATIIGLARRGISLQLHPRGARQHLAHMDLLADVVGRVLQDDAVPNLSCFVVADPFTVTNRELEDIIRQFQQRKGLPLPLPVHWLSALLRRTFHSRHPRLDLKTMGEILGVMASDIVYDPSETYRLLKVDPSRYSIDKTLLPAIVESLK
jgi:nucleoside-diphosphate-sugar epimerase